MTVSVKKADNRPWRVFRFAPLRSGTWLHGSEYAAGRSATTLQRAVSEGFREGTEKGYRDGFEQGLEAGRQQGMEEGHAHGRQLGIDEGKLDGRRIFELASRPLEQIHAEMREYLDSYEILRRKELLELVQKVARQVIRCELTLNPAQLLTLADEALAAMPGEPDEVEVLLNPEEFARIRDLAPERAESWRLVPDARLSLGECRVVTLHTEADVGCQQRLDSCMNALREHMQVSEV
jgi:flagellar assembly protein FliH